jgi:hypothetical protein
MPKNNKQTNQSVPLREGYQPFKKGYQPTQGNLNPSNPPKGGSGLPSTPSNNNGKNNNKS